jgi:hypothetical protein
MKPTAPSKHKPAMVADMKPTAPSNYEKPPVETDRTVETKTGDVGRKRAQKFPGKWVWPLEGASIIAVLLGTSFPTSGRISTRYFEMHV